MERAAAIADDALADVLPLLAEAGSRPGCGGTLTESRFAAALDHAMRRARGRGQRLRDHRGLGGELGQAPRPARAAGPSGPATRWWSTSARCSTGTART